MKQVLTRDEARALGVPQFHGFDGRGYDIGDRVESQERGRFYRVVGASLTPEDRVHVEPEKQGSGLQYRGPEKAFRKA